MRIEDRLDKDTRNKLNILRGANKKKKDKMFQNKHQENLSEKDIVNLMGVHRCTYKRYRRAFRQK